PPRILPLSLHDALPISEFQQPGGNEHCGSIERFAATFAWFEEKLKGRIGAVDASLTSGENVCMSLADGSAVHVAQVKKGGQVLRSEEHTSELQSRFDLV